MSYLVIRNKGEIEMEALTLMGATNKEGDSSKIGFFGSGNKYAIATLLRWGIELRIFSGLTEYKITTEEVSFRNVVYQKILINNVATSLTTRMGPAWEPWMAIRELYSNATDEGFIDMSEVPEVQGSVEGETAIYVQVTSDIQKFMDELGNYFNQEEPMDSVTTSYGRVDILDNQNGQRFRKNISCINDPMKSCYSYNFDNITINESRIIAFDYQQYEQMASALASTKNPLIIGNIIAHVNDESYLESKARWGTGYCTSKLSETWADVIIGMGLPVIHQSVADYIGKEETYNTLVLPDELVNKIKRDLPQVPIYGDFNGQSVSAEPSAELIAEVEKCNAELQSWGFEEIKVSYRKFLRTDILAQYYDGQIYLSILIPLEEVMLALYEEMTHKTTGFSDCTRSMQNHLFSEVIRLQREVHELKDRFEN